MFSTKSLAAAAAVLSLFTTSMAVDPSSKSNVAVYYGQGSNQPDLATFCSSSSIDIIQLAFIDIFPQQGNGLPGSNFGNQCWGSPYVYDGPGSNSAANSLQSECPTLAADILTCQKAGKTVLLSLGGQAGTYQLTGVAAGIEFADFLWGAFGPRQDSWVAGNNPRPFDIMTWDGVFSEAVVVDGFDFDIEAPALDLSSGYIALLTRLRSHFASDASKDYYLSASPQCIVPDDNMGAMITAVAFDFVWVQFYNTAQCSARAWVEGYETNTISDFSFDAWTAFLSVGESRDAKVFIGLLGSSLATTAGSEYYLDSAEASLLINTFYGYDNFGGVMIWEATTALNNPDGPYYDSCKSILNECGPQPVSSSTIAISTTSSPTSTAAQTISSSIQTSASSSSSSVSSGVSSVSFPSGSSSVSIPLGTGSSSIVASSVSFPTGVSNSTISSPTGTGSSSIIASSASFPTGASNSTVSCLTGTGSSIIASSSASFPTGTSNSTISGPTGTGSSSIVASSAPFPTGTSNSAISGPTGTGSSATIASSSAPFSTAGFSSSASVPVGTASSVTESSVFPSGTAASRTRVSSAPSSFPTGGSSSFTASGTLSVTPFSSGASSSTFPSGTGESFLSLSSSNAITISASSLASAPSSTNVSPSGSGTLLPSSSRSLQPPYQKTTGSVPPFPYKSSTALAPSSSLIGGSGSSSSILSVPVVSSSTGLFSGSSGFPIYTTSGSSKNWNATTFVSSAPSTVLVSSASEITSIAGIGSSATEFTSSSSILSFPSEITSTVIITTTSTITSCAATVTDCPARIGSVTTETLTTVITIPATTVVGGSGSTSTATAIAIPLPTESSSNSETSAISPVSDTTVLIVSTKTVQPLSTPPAVESESGGSASETTIGSSPEEIVSTTTIHPYATQTKIVTVAFATPPISAAATALSTDTGLGSVLSVPTSALSTATGLGLGSSFGNSTIASTAAASAGFATSSATTVTSTPESSTISSSEPVFTGAAGRSTSMGAGALLISLGLGFFCLVL